MPDPVEALVLDLLEWIGPRARPYAEVMDAWRTSCPRLPVWEDANDHGFVEPGESVEDAVRREVLEESGILVDRIRYFGSQPWPYPNSLMLGFQAEYAGGELCLTDAELEAADWYRVDELPRLFPGNVSIAQWLIHDFLARKRGSAG